MPKSRLYHSANRALQDEMGTRALADVLEGLARTRFSDDDKSFIQSAIYFFLATADREGRPDCSFKGGPPGFVRLTGPSELAFPDYDGNGMFKSLGNLGVNPHVGILFMAMGEAPKRLRVNGRAEVTGDDPRIAAIPGAQLLVKVTPLDIFPNCPRYVPNMQLVAPSIYAPDPEQAPVEPAWKSFELFEGVVPPRRR